MHVPHSGYYMRQYWVWLQRKGIECRQGIFVKSRKLPIPAYLKLQTHASYWATGRGRGRAIPLPPFISILGISWSNSVFLWFYHESFILLFICDELSSSSFSIILLVVSFILKGLVAYCSGQGFYTPWGTRPRRICRMQLRVVVSAKGGKGGD